MEEKYLPPVKHTFQVRVNYKPLHPPDHRQGTTGGLPASSSAAGKRTFRFFSDDHDATESSDDESCYRRVKRFVEEISFEEWQVRNADAVKSGVGEQMKKNRLSNEKPRLPARKFRGFRRRPWEKFGAEIRDPTSRVRLWLGIYDTAEEASMMYNSAAIQLRGPDAATNFPTVAAPATGANLSASGGYESSEDSRNISMSSPISVLRGFSAARANVDSEKAADDNRSLSPDLAGEFMLFDEMPLYSEFLEFSAFEPRIFEELPAFEVGLFAGDEAMVNSGGDIGSWKCEEGNDFFEGITDLFPLEPLL